VRAIAKRKVPHPVLGELAALGAAVAIPLKYRRRSHPMPAGVSFEPISTFDARFDIFWAKVAPTFRNLCVRDAAYLNWRYVQIPDRRYRSFAAFDRGEIRGWIVTREIQDGELRKARIVDVLARADDAPAWHVLVSEAVARCRAEGADLVHALDATVPALHEAYRACGFRPNPEQDRVAQYIAFTTAPGVDRDAFYAGQNWFVTLGDSDTDFATPA
jgi:hypothetical protein